MSSSAAVFWYLYSSPSASSCRRWQLTRRLYYCWSECKNWILRRLPHLYCWFWLSLRTGWMSPCSGRWRGWSLLGHMCLWRSSVASGWRNLMRWRLCCLIVLQRSACPKSKTYPGSSRWTAQGHLRSCHWSCCWGTLDLRFRWNASCSCFSSCSRRSLRHPGSWDCGLDLQCVQRQIYCRALSLWSV